MYGNVSDQSVFVLLRFNRPFNKVVMSSQSVTLPQNSWVSLLGAVDQYLEPTHSPVTDTLLFLIQSKREKFSTKECAGHKKVAAQRKLRFQKQNIYLFFDRYLENVHIKYFISRLPDLYCSLHKLLKR